MSWTLLFAGSRPSRLAVLAAIPALALLLVAARQPGHAPAAQQAAAPNVADLAFFAEGALRMTPFPFGNKSVEFTATSVDAKARKAVFENAAHDWPTKFVFEAASADKLRIVLSGPEGVPPGTVTLELTRTK